MRTFHHLTPSASVTQDSVLVAAVAHAEVLAETRSPRAAMSAAFDASGVGDLEDRFDALTEAHADLQRRHDRALAALAPPHANGTPTDGRLG